jgi:hypothetical protein
MYKLLLVLASAQALKRPQQRALAVRGGEIDPITIGKGVVLASGIYGAFDPKGNLDKYGIKAEAKGQAAGRMTAWGQIMFAAALNLDPETAHGQMAYHCLAMILITEAPSEVFGAPKAPSAIWMAILGAVGYKTLDGTLNKWVPTALWLANGAQCFLSPDSICDMYGIKGANKIVKAMFSLMGGQMLCIGTYLAALLMDKSQSEAFAYAMAVNGVAAAKYALMDADDLNAPKTGALGWAAISAGLAYKALN